MNPRKTFYVRVEPDVHERVMKYAATYDFTANDVIVSLIQQLLVQVDPSFPVPEYLSKYFRRPVQPDRTTAPKS